MTRFGDFDKANVSSPSELLRAADKRRDVQARLEALDFDRLREVLRTVGGGHVSFTDQWAHHTVTAAKKAFECDRRMGINLLPAHLYVLQVMLSQEGYGPRVDLFVEQLRIHVSDVQELAS